ncbi:MAG: hypothetical protein Ct9H300mP19_08690 [Dehalococcoidia bacterium]|nr:MAG: hypothetical protein Ct9H300mP19_08690 [Dehalococcoidia bacterium]
MRLIETAAQRFGPTITEGALDPDLRVEDIFFASTVLGRAFRSSGKTKHIALLTEFLESFTTLQSNNLWWHCKTAPYFWGRGNAFAALGLAEAITYLPINHPSRSKLIQTHLDILKVSQHTRINQGCGDKSLIDPRLISNTAPLR